MLAELCNPVADPVDETLHDLEMRLQAHLGSRVRHLVLVAREDGVVLHGVARTYYAKQLAQHAVMASFGYRVASNEIEVLSPRTPTPCAVLRL
jgi:hypothetical protein